MSIYALAPAIGIAGLTCAALIYLRIRSLPTGGGIAEAIAGEIHQGAMVFLKREIRALLLFVIVVGALLALKSPYETFTFLIGAACSSTAGFVGMYTATQANVRTTYEANLLNPDKALSIAFFGGSIMGLTVASLGLCGIGTLFYFFEESDARIENIHGFAMGASLVALFFRVGGGIFTKAADVGSDLVGKVEAGIPEDDPRNPGVIADNVGDNVGDIAGMGSDIFESYCGSQIATIAIAATCATEVWASLSATRENLMFLPISMTATGLLCSLFGYAMVKLLSRSAPIAALRYGMIAATASFIGTSFLVTRYLDIEARVWYCILIGAAGGILIGLVTEYYTAGKPVREIAKASETGVATVMISGLAAGLESVVIPLLSFGLIVFFSSAFAGIYGVAIAAVGMLSTVAMTMAIDAYGPVADNAGGIAEMSKMGEKARSITDSLDEVGNTTAAIGKGFAIGAAGLAALAIIGAYINVIRSASPDFRLDLGDPEVLAGIFLGALIPAAVAAITMKSVGKAAHEMINEIRRQFRRIPGLLEGTAKPENARCIDIATQAALRRMVLPSAIAISAPVAVGFGLGPQALGGLLGGALPTCVLLALMMSNAGGAWDNAKKYVEKGYHGGKGSHAHKAVVVGDTVGDPFKDTSGPSMNILINVMAIVSLVIAPVIG